MDRPTKPYKGVKSILGNASLAWEKLTGYIRYNYIMDEIWAEGKPTHKNRNNLYFKRGVKRESKNDTRNHQKSRRNH